MESHILIDQGPSFASTGGPFFIGNVLSGCLYGVLAVQVALYFDRYQHDRPIMKVMVGTVMFLDTIVTAFSIHLGFHQIFIDIAHLPWSHPSLPLLSGLVSLQVQIFFAWRMYKLQHSAIIPLFVCLISLLSCIMAGYVGIKSFILGLPRFSELNVEVGIWLGSAVVADTIISTALVWVLARHSRRSIIQATRGQLLRLIMLTLETGTLTTATALLELLFFLLLPQSSLYFMWFFILSKVYANSLMAMLNARRVISSQEKLSGRHPLWVDTRASESLSFPTSPARVEVTRSVQLHKDPPMEMHSFDSKPLPDHPEDSDGEFHDTMRRATIRLDVP